VLGNPWIAWIRLFDFDVNTFQQDGMDVQMASHGGREGKVSLSQQRRMI